MAHSHFGGFDCDSTANDLQCILSAVSIESQSIANPLQMDTPQRLYVDCAETALQTDLMWSRQKVRMALSKCAFFALIAYNENVPR